MMKHENLLRLLLCFFFISQANSAHGIEAVNIHIPGTPCNGLVLSNVLSRHANVRACSASWIGHIERGSTGICNAGWHVCSWKDHETLKKISWFEATRISGCYAINAAHDGTHCQECLEGGANGEMAAIGADCLVSDLSSRSCFGRGKIDASSRLAADFTACHSCPWITGVLCCKDEEKGRAPSILRYPKPYVDVISGSNVTLSCTAEGDPPPAFHWLRNGKRLNQTLSRYSKLNGELTIRSVTTQDGGYYHCEAINEFGSAVSYKSMVRVKENRPSNATLGCRHPMQGIAINSGDVAVCKGRWRGHVKKASKKLCARGWRVCSLKDTRTLQGMQWEEITTKLPGCYAYNAASSLFFPCSSCIPKRRGNRMAGLGSGCGKRAFDGYSCLKQGRIDVKAEISFLPRHKNRTRQRTITRRVAPTMQRSCSYDNHVTSGVVCCKIRSKHSLRARTNINADVHSKRCNCKNGGVCTRGRRCKCKSGFAGKRCQRKVRKTCCK